MASPIFRFNGGTAGQKRAVSPGALMTCTLASTLGVKKAEWSFIGSDGTAYPELTLSGSPHGATCNFTMPSAPCSFVLECTINDGVNDESQPDPTLSATSKVYVTTSNLLFEIPASGETLESDSAFGWAPQFTALFLAADEGTGGSISVSEDGSIIVSEAVSLNFIGATVVDAGSGVVDITTAGGSLASVLATGNTTEGIDIVFTAGDQIKGVDGLIGNDNGGGISIRAGLSLGTGSAGATSIYGGNSDATGTPGDIYLSPGISGGEVPKRASTYVLSALYLSDQTGVILADPTGGGWLRVEGDNLIFIDSTGTPHTVV